MLGLSSAVALAAGGAAGCGDETREHRTLPPVTTTTTVTGVGGNGGQGGGELPLHCVNLTLDEDESDVDCGGSCEPCPTGGKCGSASDCASKNCENGECAAPTCTDALQNGEESDVDCGGAVCDGCPNGKNCVDPTDCVVMNCVKGKCADPKCDDEVKNGAETDVDCGGGGLCVPCADGETCVQSSDCQSNVCSGGVCKSSNCNNGVKEPEETDVDCGGICAPCADGLVCVGAADCQSQKCENGVCAPPTCVDQLANGDESDVDCGGAACAPCGNGEGCFTSTDCTSKVCVGNVCQAPACNDGVKNGMETDLDCGGPCPADCPLGQGCTTNTDCATQNCKTNICECPAKMVKVPKTTQGAYCIDQTEVTYHDYALFLNANPPVQPAFCSGNVYIPLADWPPPANTEGKPVHDVDWCDALAYCTYVGKHLCGQVGGGSNGYADYASADLSEWYNACSIQGVNVYPYGSPFDTDLCVEHIDAPLPIEAVEVQDHAQSYNVIQSPCQGGQIGLYHMSGNLAEWEDSCDAANGGTDNCRLRGGSWNSSQQAALMCASPGSAQRSAHSAEIGFRCCL